MYANYHTHTVRCGHACGTDEEYVRAGIAAGFKILGISDHGPCMFPDGFESGYRVKVAQLPDYFSSLSALREKYADQVELHIGFELEYYPLHYKSMIERIRSTDAEYLILGQHAIFNERPDRMMVARGFDDPALLKEYVDEVCEALTTDSFTYVAHPEVFLFRGPDDLYLEEMRRVCVKARETGTPLEINFLGLRDHRPYPREDFWKMAGEEHVDVIFGSDAHDPNHLDDQYSLKIATEWVERYNLHLLDTVEFRKP